jgi:energy-coupling factor transporter ATP-binding protein EcfA2
MTLRKKTLLKGIGIENFKAFPEYTYIPIESLSMFIGPNGSGKSSAWQLVQLLQSTLRIEPKKGDKDELMVLYKTDLTLEDYPDLGYDPNVLLWDKDKPLVVTWNSQVSIGKNIDCEKLIGFRFMLTPRRGDMNSGFVLNSFELIDENDCVLFKFSDHEQADMADGTPYLVERSEQNMDNLAQYLLDIAHDIDKAGQLGLFMAEDGGQVTWNESDEFYNWQNHDCKMRYYEDQNSGIHFGPFLKGFNWETGCEVVKSDSEKDEPVGLYLFFSDLLRSLDGAEEPFEEFKNLIRQTAVDKGDLNILLNRFFNSLRGTFRQLMDELKQINVLTRRTIGFSENRIKMESGTGKFLKGFLNVHEDAKREDQQFYAASDFSTLSMELAVGSAENVQVSFKSYSSLRKELFAKLGFDKPSVIRKDPENNTIWIEVGGVNLRNVGMGFWSLAFILDFLFCSIVERKKIIIIEEPELNLHPSLQVELMDVIIELVVKYNITVVLETHSEYMLRRLQLRVHEGGLLDGSADLVGMVRKMYRYNNFRSVKIDAGKVVVNSFESLENESGLRGFRCRPIRLDNQGYMSEPLPWTFSSVAANDAVILNEWLHRGSEN